MRTVFLIITLLLGIIASAQVKLHHTTKNTWSYYSDEREEANEINDCSVRAMSVIFDLSYSESLELTSKWSREPRTGISGRMLVNMVESMGYETEKFVVGGLNSRQFAKYMAMPNYDFFAISKRHVHALKWNDDKQKLFAYGNPMDTNLKIIYVIAIKK